MSALYGFELIFPRASLRKALGALSMRANPEGYEGCVIELPGEPALDFPFDAGSEDGPIERFVVGKYEPFQFLEGSMWFPTLASIGNISLFIHITERYGILRLSAVTGNMSWLFDESPVIRKQMALLLKEGDGLVALFTRDRGDPFEVLDADGKALRTLPVHLPDWEDAQQVDPFVASILPMTR